MRWVLVDVPYLCHRAFHSTGDLSFKGVKTGVLYGVLRDISDLTDRFRTENLVFCFDSKDSIRRDEIYPGYKAKRLHRILTATPEERKIRGELDRQMTLLRRRYLPAIGYKNVFVQRGYEADDLIATITLESINSARDEVVIVSADKDLYQLLAGYASIFNPRTGKLFTYQLFYEQWGIHPLDWPRVKAWAGCSTDDVPGVPGVGEKTAAKFIKGELDPESNIRLRILENVELFKTNMRLVSLPLPGCKPPELQLNKLSEKGWKRVMDHLGIRSFGYAPILRIAKPESTKHGKSKRKTQLRRSQKKRSGNA